MVDLFAPAAKSKVGASIIRSGAVYDLVIACLHIQQLQILRPSYSLCGDARTCLRHPATASSRKTGRRVSDVYSALGADAVVQIQFHGNRETVRCKGRLQLRHAQPWWHPALAGFPDKGLSCGTASVEAMRQSATWHPAATTAAGRKPQFIQR